MKREKPQTMAAMVPARLPRKLIQPLRIILITGFLLSAMFVFTAESTTLTQILLVAIQVVLSLALLAECGRSAAFYRTLDEAEAAARRREQE